MSNQNLNSLLKNYRYKKLTKAFLSKFEKRFVILPLLFFHFIIFESFFYFSKEVKIGVWIFLILLSGFQLYKTYKKYLRKTANFRKGERKVAEEFEKEFQNTSVFQYYDLLKLKDENKNSDTSLIDEAIKKKQSQFDKEYYKNILPFNFIFKKISKPIILIMLFILSSFISQKLENAIYRVLEFNKNFTPPLSHKLLLQNKHYTAIEGDTLNISLKISGELPENILMLKKNMNTDKWSEISIIPDDSLITITTQNLSDNFNFLFQSEETKSDTGLVEVLKYPRMEKLSLDINYPDYTKKPDELIDILTEPLNLIKGTEIIFNAVAEEKTDSVKITFNSTDTTLVKRMDKENKKFTYSEKFMASTSFYLNLYKNKIKSKSPVKYEINIFNDEYPIVKVLSPENGYLIPDDLKIPLICAADDDYGILSMYIYAEKEGNNGSEKKKIKQRLKFKTLEDNSRVFSGYVDLSELNLFPDDMITFFIRVYDNDRISGPKYADSDKISIKLPTLEQMFENVEDNYSTQEEMVLKQLEKSENIKDDIKKLSDELKVSNNMDSKNKMKLENMISQQKDMLQNLDKLDENIQKNIEELKKGSLLSKETLKKYEKLQKMMDEIFTEDFKNKLQQINEMSDKEYSPKDFQKLLSELEEHQKQFEESLEKTMEILKQIQNEYKLDKLIKKIEELIDKQEALNYEALDEPMKDNLIAKENAIEKEYDKFKKELSGLDTTMQDISDQMKDGIKDIKEESENNNIDKDFENFKNNSSEKQFDKAYQSGKDAQGKMEQLSSSLNNLKDQFVQEQKDKLDKEIAEIIDRLLTLTIETEDLSDDTQDIGKESKTGSMTIVAHKHVLDSFIKVSDKIYEAAQKSFFIDNNVSMQINEVSKNLDRTENILINRNFRSSSYFLKASMGKINDLIVMLYDVRENIKNSKSASGLEEMLKKMQQMAQEQSKMNQQGQSMMEGSQGMPRPGQGQTPGGGSSESMMEMMNRLAQEQVALQKALQQMMGEMGMQPGGQGGGKEGGNRDAKSGGDGEKTGEGSDSAGRGKGEGLGKKLKDMDGQMDEILNEMEDKVMTESILKKQKNLYKHMLETIKSMRRERFDNKREGNDSDLKAVDPGKIDFNDPRNSLKNKLLRSLRDGYNDEYKTKIRKYFENISK